MFFFLAVSQQLITVVSENLFRRRHAVFFVLVTGIIHTKGHGQAVRHVPVHEVDPEFHEIAVFNAIAAEGRSVSILFPRRRQRWVV